MGEVLRGKGVRSYRKCVGIKKKMTGRYRWVKKQENRMRVINVILLLYR